MNNFDQSENQLTLGQLIEKLEKIDPMYEWSHKDKEEKKVRFCFEYAVPTKLNSWRGDYSELAIGFDFVGYSRFSEKPNEVLITEFIKMLKNAIGNTYEGWKGGTYRMSEKTRIWVANPGNAGETGIIDVVDQNWNVYLVTGYCEY